MEIRLTFAKEFAILVGHMRVTSPKRPLTVFCFVFQQQPRKHGDSIKYKFSWMYANGCACKSRLKQNPNLWTLELKSRHNRDSHKDLQGNQITENQKLALKNVVRTNPLCNARAARRATQSMDPGSLISPE